MKVRYIEPKQLKPLEVTLDELQDENVYKDVMRYAGDGADVTILTTNERKGEARAIAIELGLIADIAVRTTPDHGIFIISSKNIKGYHNVPPVRELDPAKERTGIFRLTKTNWYDARNEQGGWGTNYLPDNLLKGLFAKYKGKDVQLLINALKRKVKELRLRWFDSVETVLDRCISYLGDNLFITRKRYSSPISVETPLKSSGRGLVVYIDEEGAVQGGYMWKRRRNPREYKDGMKALKRVRSIELRIHNNNRHILGERPYYSISGLGGGWGDRIPPAEPDERTSLEEENKYLEAKKVELLKRYAKYNIIQTHYENELREIKDSEKPLRSKKRVLRADKGRKRGRGDERSVGRAAAQIQETTVPSVFRYGNSRVTNKLPHTILLRQNWH